MCDVEEPVMTREAAPRERRCIKCKTNPPAVQARDPFCKDCFSDAILYKFRSILGKARVMKPTDKVLLAYSGGLSSSTMLFALHSMLETENFKKRVGFPVVVGFVCEDALFGMTGTTEQVRALTARYGYPFQSIGIEEVFSSKVSVGHDFSQILVDATGSDSKAFDEVRVALAANEKQPAEALKELFNNVKTLTAREELLSHLRTRILVHLAETNQCNKIFMGENGTRMAVKIISLTSKGRGYSLPFESAFQDTRFPGVSILRPMKDILGKEIGIFSHYHKIDSVALPTFTSFETNPKASIEHLTEEFVTALQRDFPSTVGAITKTAEKFSFNGTLDPTTVCVICHSPRSESINRWKQSIMYLPDKRKQQPESASECCAGGSCSSGSACGEEKGKEKATADLNLEKYTCYGCQVSLRDYQKITFPPYVAEAVTQATKAERVESLRDQIKDFLLEDE